MKDYQPVSFARQCNCGISVFGDHKPPVGSGNR